MDASPIVDGRLEERVWRQAHAITDLRQQDPIEGAPATEATEVRVLIHGSTLFVGFRAHDSEPRGVIHRVWERDDLMEVRTDGSLAFRGDDAVAFLIDADHDGRTAQVFATNPNGAEFDAQVSGEGREINVAWRGVWTVAATPGEDGWSAELAVPLRTLRTSSSNGGVWGFNVYRVIRRKNEHALWRSWRRGTEGFLRVSEAGQLSNLATAQAEGLGVDMKPYAAAALRPRVGQPGTEGLDWDGGVDVKYELRPGLILDGTLNADFAQAEVDDEQVNLTRYDLFLPERREFFLENSGIFEFGSRVQGEVPPFLLFFSRRIGIAHGALLPLRAGTRISGRAGAQTIGLLHAETGAVGSEPARRNSVVRAKRDMGARGYAGGMFTHRGSTDGSNATGGVDWSLWPTGALNVRGFVVRTGSSGVGGEGWAVHGGVEYQTDRVGFTGQYLEIDRNLEAGLGFVPRTDVRRAEGLLRLSTQPDFFRLRRVDLFLLAQGVTRTDGTFQDRVMGPALSLTWNSDDRFVVFVRDRASRVDEDFLLSGRLPVSPGRYGALDVGLNFLSSPSRPLSTTIRVLAQRDFGGDLLSASGAAQLALGRATIEASLSHYRADLPSGAFTSNVTSVAAALSFSTKATLSARFQRNSLDGSVVSTARLQWSYRPGSDLYVVLQDGVAGLLDDDPDGPLLIVKLTWLARF